MDRNALGRAELFARLCLPVVGAPMFLLSSPALLIAQCRAGMVGSMPALNARSSAQLDAELDAIDAALGPDDAPHAINLILTPGNTRLSDDLAVCERHRVPLIITSVGAPGDIVARVHGWGGMVLHDVISVRHLEKAAEAGVDGVVLVCAGAGGHGGQLNPFGFLGEARRHFDGLIALAGSLHSGADILAAQIAGADLAYMGTRFIASAECAIEPAYRQILLDACADDIVASDWFTGMRANYLAASIERAGLPARRLPAAPAPGVGSGGHGEFKVWKDIWSAGHGVGEIADFPPVAELVARLREEYLGAADRAAALAADLK
jgi:nitronate monooxygenase